jgi:tetratricopeptide (TPR) repeat protein
LWLSLGYLDRAREAAKRAASLAPDEARANTVLGFMALARVDIGSATTAFERAIAIESGNPLARLGLGLAKIRKGRLADGRREIEFAAALNPDDPIVRSYLGKAYFEEKREPLPGPQFERAKQIDPLDPTPWFYDAIRKQTLNRPIEALQDLEQSIKLNNNRAVYRSRFLLDADLAARGASLGRIYRDVGFEQLALVEGWKSSAIADREGRPRASPRRRHCHRTWGAGQCQERSFRLHRTARSAKSSQISQSFLGPSFRGGEDGSPGAVQWRRSLDPTAALPEPTVA